MDICIDSPKVLIAIRMLENIHKSKNGATFKNISPGSLVPICLKTALGIRRTKGLP